MTDDPREILRAAGVKCAPLDSWEKLANAVGMTTVAWEKTAAELGFGDAAILALAQLVAKYKWQRDYLSSEDDFAYLDHCWEEHNA